MGEHRFNPVAQANDVPRGEVSYMKLCDGYGLLGVGLQPAVDANGVLHVFLMASVARVSELVPIKQIVKIALTEAVRIDVKELVAKIATELDGPDAPQPPVEIAPS